jgi:hypothetical protein
MHIWGDWVKTHCIVHEMLLQSNFWKILKFIIALVIKLIKDLTIQCYIYIIITSYEFFE